MPARPTSSDPLEFAAVANNASWCDVVSTAHGCATRTDHLAWSTSTRPPAYYPDAVTLSPATRAGDILDRIDASPGCGVKDSFASLDLTAAGWMAELGKAKPA